MRLRNINPTDLIGRTIVYRHQFWTVDRLDDAHVYLTKSWNDNKGLLRHDQLRDCRLYPTRSEVTARYPRLLFILKEACLLTSGEAEGAIHGYLTTGPQFAGSEAVAHVGGARRAIEHALRCRNYTRNRRRLICQGKALEGDQAALPEFFPHTLTSNTFP
jgi:hypothetical protein